MITIINYDYIKQFSLYNGYKATPCNLVETMGFHLSKKIRWNFWSSVKTHDPSFNIAVGGSVQFFNSSDGIGGTGLGLEEAIVADAEHVGIVRRVVGGAIVVLRHLYSPLTTLFLRKLTCDFNSDLNLS